MAGTVDGQIADGFGGMAVVETLLFLDGCPEAGGTEVSHSYAGSLRVVLGLLGEKQVGDIGKGLVKADVVPLFGAREGEATHFPETAVGLGVAPRWQSEQGDILQAVVAIEVIPLLDPDADLGGDDVVEGRHRALPAVVGERAGDDHRGGAVLAQVDTLCVVGGTDALQQGDRGTRLFPDQRDGLSFEVDILPDYTAALVVLPEQFPACAVTETGNGAVDALFGALALAVVGVAGAGRCIAEADHAVGIIIEVAADETRKGVAGFVVGAVVGGATEDLQQPVAVGDIAVGLGGAVFGFVEAVAGGIITIAEAAVAAEGAGKPIEGVVTELLVPAGVEQVLPGGDVAHRVVTVAALQDTT